jgi:outer membrane protein
MRSNQLMNIPYVTDMKLERLQLEESLLPYGGTAHDIFEKVSGQMAFVKAAALRTKSAEYNFKAIKGLLYPTLSLNGSYNTNYSSAARLDILVNTSETPTSNYVLVNGSKIPVVARQSNYTSEKISYNSQLRNNVFSNFSLSLQVPLFNSFRVRNRMKLAKIDISNNQDLKDNALLQLRQQVDQAFINLNTAWERYKTLLDAERAYAEAFRAAEVRFNSGVGTSIDYVISKNNLDRTQVSLLSAKYDYVLYRKVLDYYSYYKL